VFRIGVAFDPRLANADTLCRTIAALYAFWRGPLELHKLRTVHVAAECAPVIRPARFGSILAVDT
jgi:hypothetical protein